MWWLAPVLLAQAADARALVVAPAETLQVAVAGAGPPVVLVPGLFGWPATRDCSPVRRGAWYSSG